MRHCLYRYDPVLGIQYVDLAYVHAVRVPNNPKLTDSPVDRVWGARLGYVVVDKLHKGATAVCYSNIHYEKEYRNQSPTFT